MTNAQIYIGIHDDYIRQLQSIEAECMLERLDERLTWLKLFIDEKRELAMRRISGLRGKIAVAQAIEGVGKGQGNRSMSGLEGTITCLEEEIEKTQENVCEVIGRASESVSDLEKVRGILSRDIRKWR